MGRNLFWRKAIALTLFIAAYFAPQGLYAQGRPQDVFAGTENRRYASRQLMPDDLQPGPRQFHGGPEVYSPAFSLTGEVSDWMARIQASDRETGHILTAMERSRPYACFIRQKIAEYGLPPEIFYLPVVESLYKIGAHSRADALGLWQFMHASSQPWMRIDEWVDERKDFWKSTVAAMEKLKQNYSVTKDWLLALAAYNCGLGKIQRIMKESGLNDFWEISRRGLLPRETRAYVPRLIATARIASSLGRRGFGQDWAPPVLWTLVPVETPIDLGLLAESAGLPRAELAAGNEELRYGITPPANSYALKVKAEDAPKIREALKQNPGGLMRFAIHTIREGHTLSEIARHYGISVALLLRYNPGMRPEALRIGTRLVVPLYRDTPPFVKKLPPPETGIVFPGEYTVKTGDSLWTIARFFDTTSAALAAANDIPENGLLKPGAVLKVPAAKAEDKR